MENFVKRKMIFPFYVRPGSGLCVCRLRLPEKQKGLFVCRFRASFHENMNLIIF